jgi:glycerol-3-phosphate acyltransferase PlsY
MSMFHDSDFWVYGLALPVVLAYLLGSIPTAVWVSKAFYRQDVRTLGSKNAGSTNMYRVFGLKAGLPVQLMDIAKGSLAALLPAWLVAAAGLDNVRHFDLTIAALVAGFAAVLGHVYTCFAGFKGGKGVNTMLGMMLVVEPLGCLVGIGVFVAVLLLGRMVSLGSMLAVLSFPVYIVLRAQASCCFSDYDWLMTAVGTVLTVLVVYTHRSNIGRIVAGNERKVNLFGNKKPA